MVAWHGDGRTASLEAIRAACKSAGLVQQLSDFLSPELRPEGLLRLLMAFYFHQQVMALEGFSSAADIRELSRRERDMLWWTAEGKTTKEIALILGLSDRTVRFYIENAMTKLRCHSKAQCVAKAIRIGAL